MCFLLLSEPKFLHSSSKSFLDKDHVQLSDSEVKWQCRNKFPCTQYPSPTWMVTHWHTGVRKEPKSIILHKVRHVEGWTNLKEIWKPALKTQFRESLSCFVVLGMKMLRIFHRCSAGSRTVPDSHAGNASGSTESCGDDLHCIERGHSPARLFHQEQAAAWRVGNAGSLPLCSSFTLMWSCPQSSHASLFMFLPLGIFWSSCYMWILMVICGCDILTTNTNSSFPLVLFGGFYLFDWFVWVCLFGFLSGLVWAFCLLF